MEAFHILIVEDDKEIREGIEIYLKNQGYQVSQAADGLEGLEQIQAQEIHLAIVDVMMPRMDGITMMMKVREQGYDFPVIMLSAKSEEVDKIMGLNMGADDYVTKPFSMPVLLRKIAAVLRRADSKENGGGALIHYKGLTLDMDGYRVYAGDVEFELTQREFEVLRELLTNQGKALSRQHFLNKLWKYDFYGDERVVDTHIKNLRKKLDIDYIETIRGVGYKIEKEDKK